MGRFIYHFRSLRSSHVCVECFLHNQSLLLTTLLHFRSGFVKLSSIVQSDRLEFVKTHFSFFSCVCFRRRKLVIAKQNYRCTGCGMKIERGESEVCCHVGDISVSVMVVTSCFKFHLTSPSAFSLLAQDIYDKENGIFWYHNEWQGCSIHQWEYHPTSLWQQLRILVNELPSSLNVTTWFTFNEDFSTGVWWPFLPMINISEPVCSQSPRPA